MDKKIIGGVKEKKKRDLACLICGGKQNLQMYPHSKGGNVVGFIYSCCSIKPRNRFVLEEIDSDKT